MPDNHPQFDGARVLADLNALRGIGAYKTGVHKPTFSEPHMRSLEWLAERLPEAGLTAEIDGIGNVLGTSTKSGPKLLAGSHLESQNFEMRPRQQFRPGFRGCAEHIADAVDRRREPCLGQPLRQPFQRAHMGLRERRLVNAGLVGADAAERKIGR